MINALKKLFSSANGHKESKHAAKSRLSFVLVQDRTGLTQDEIANFKKEMVSVIEKYFVIDETGLDVSYKRETDSTMLIINSPVVVKRQSGFKHSVGSKGAISGQTINSSNTAATTKASKEEGQAISQEAVGS